MVRPISAVSTLVSELFAVPAASERMLQKSLTTTSDVIIYDLEDSVPPTKTDKEGARERLARFFQVCSLLYASVTPSLRYVQTKTRTELPHPDRVAIRLNSTNTPFFEDDLAAAVSSNPSICYVTCNHSYMRVAANPVYPNTRPTEGPFSP